MNASASPRRQILAVLGMVVAMIATVATSYALPDATTTSGGQQIHVDGQHALASQLFVVTIPADAAVGLSDNTATVSVDQVVAHDSAGNTVPGDQAVVVRVLPVDPQAPAGATFGVAAPKSTPVVPLTLSQAARQSIDLGCEAPGPCDRAYRVIVTLRSGAADATVTWSVEGVIRWGDSAYPSPVVDFAIRVDPALVLDRAAPVLDVSTAPEEIRLGSQAPGLARLAELTYTPTVGMAYVPVETLTVDVTPPSYGRAILAAAYLVSPPASSTSASPPGAATGRKVAPNDNVFADCIAGTTCTRTVLVTLSWTTGGEADYEWSLTAHRSDLDRALSEPPTIVSIKTADSFTPLADSAGHLHFEGDITVPGDASTASVMLCAAPQLTGSSSAQPYRDLLPIPATINYAFAVKGVPLDPYDMVLSVRANSSTGTNFPYLGEAKVPIDLGLFAGSTPGSGCPVLDFGDQYGSAPYFRRSDPSAAPSPGYSYIHWTVDVTVYSYAGLTYSVERRPAPPKP